MKIKIKTILPSIGKRPVDSSRDRGYFNSKKESLRLDFLEDEIEQDLDLSGLLEKLKK